jgi:hypothetical protein
MMGTTTLSLFFFTTLGESNAPNNVEVFLFSTSSSIVHVTATQGAAVPTTVPEPGTWVVALLGFAAHRRAKLRGPVGFSAA